MSSRNPSAPSCEAAWQPGKLGWRPDRTHPELFYNKASRRPV